MAYHQRISCRLPLPLSTICFIAVLVLVATLLITVAPVKAHPGAVADGRATCGSEYSTPETAYNIPDMTEAWYLRRIATCASPQFWTTFEITAAKQPFYIAVISPKIERFQDQLQFHGILYGNGIVSGNTTETGLTEIPDTLPEGIQHDSELATTVGGSAYFTSPSDLSTCNFVDTNPVMKEWSNVIDGRCMEEFAHSVDFSDPLQQDTTSYSWWLYSFNHVAVEPGTYYLQTWLTSPSDTNVTTQGKYEMTLGPWTWNGYATDSTLDLAQSQGTSCSCAVNALDYKENYLERLGELEATLQEAQLSGTTCSSTPTSFCVTILQENFLSQDSAVEWSGLFELQAGRNYEWTFRAYYRGADTNFNNEYGYPDPGMYVLVVLSETVESAAVNADETLTRAVQEQDDTPMLTIADGSAVDMSNGSLPQFISFTDTTIANYTSVLLQPASTGRFAIFTQHVPSEFMAHVLLDRESKQYIFPISQTLYMETTEVMTNGDEEGESDQQEIEMEPSAAVTFSYCLTKAALALASLYLLQWHS